jgi:hypothetical protein
MSQKRIKQYKRVIIKELRKGRSEIIFEFIKETKCQKFWDRLVIAFWILKG